MKQIALANQEHRTGQCAHGPVQPGPREHCLLPRCVLAQRVYTHTHLCMYKSLCMYIHLCGVYVHMAMTHHHAHTLIRQWSFALREASCGSWDRSVPSWGYSDVRVRRGHWEGLGVSAHANGVSHGDVKRYDVLLNLDADRQVCQVCQIIFIYITSLLRAAR